MANLRPTAFVLVSSNHGSMLVNRHDYTTGDKGTYGVGFQILNNSCFDPNEINNVLTMLQLRRQSHGDGLVALDCGANVGAHTIEWAKLMYGWGEVIAFEAQERIFYALAGNIAINNCFNARAFNIAIGSKVDNINVPKPNYFKPSSFGSLELKENDKNEFIGQEIDYSDAASSSIQLVSIDSLNLNRLDFIKIDIEGMEVDALEGAKKSIKKFKPQMLIEKIKADEKLIREILIKQGYKIYEIDINLLAIHESDPANELINIEVKNI